MNNFYPLLNKMIYLEKKQPSYSDFFIKNSDMNFRFSVNKSAADILELCNGKNSVDNIVDLMVKKYNDNRDNVKDIVEKFIEDSVKLGNISLYGEANHKNDLKILGCEDFWSLDLITIELTYNCPLKCKHCYANAGKGKFISYDLTEKILIECKEFGNPRIQLTGGEPLTHPDFFKIINKALENDLLVSVFSSGYISNKLIIDKIMNLPRNKVSFQISVDGLDNYHNWLRGRADAFEKTVKFVQDLCEAGFSVTTATCVDKQNYNELYMLACNMKELGVKLMRISPIMNLGRARNYDKEKNLNSKVYEIVKKLATELNTDKFRIVYFEEGEEVINFKYKKNCGLGQTAIRIDPNGNVYPCVLTNIKYSNVSKHTLLDIQKKYSRVWENLYSPSKEICMECIKEEKCNQCVSCGLDRCDVNDSIFFENATKIVDKIKEMSNDN